MAEAFDFNRAAQKFLSGNYKKNPSHKRKPALENQRKQATESIVQHSRGAQSKLVESVNSNNRQTLIDRAIKPTLKVARKLSSTGKKELEKQLYDLIPKYLSKNWRVFDKKCTTIRKSIEEKYRLKRSYHPKKRVPIKSPYEKKALPDTIKALNEILDISRLRKEINRTQNSPKNKEESAFIEQRQKIFDKSRNPRDAESVKNLKSLAIMIRVISKNEGISEKGFLSFLNLESEFLPNANRVIRRRSRGLGQLQSAAIERSLKVITRSQKSEIYNLKSIAQNIHESGLIFDPLINLRLTAKYFKIAKQQAINKGFNPPKISHIYSFYNQGGGAKGFIQGRKKVRGHNPKYNTDYRDKKGRRVRSVVSRFKSMPYGDFTVR